MSTGTVGVKSRKMTVGSSPLAQVTPLMPPGPIRKAPKPGMPSSLPPESVCECFLCHDLSPYSQNPPPEIPEYQRQDLARLGPTCPSIHLFCLASRLPMSLPLDTTQKTPLARTILDYFYSTWLTNDQGSRGSSNNLADLGMSSSISSSTSYPRVQCINFIPIHPLTASGFDRYLESLPWSKRVCRPLWMAADVRCKLGMEGMYRNCMQDKCQACFIFNDGFEDTLAKNKLIYLAPHSSRVHEKSVDQQRHNAAVSGTASFRRKKSQSAAEDPLQYDDSSNMIRCMVLTFAALGCTFEVGPMEAYDGPERLKRPPKGFDIVRREYDLDDRSKVEYGVFAADAVVPLAMVLYKVF
ncbi:hypothetical protein DFQ26_002140 [Actinomortierella ambigua]|nr:hypothetical protein DFQ26_002140 [Actinomortierella ambigua]